jgi:hypothetical protein
VDAIWREVAAKHRKGRSDEPSTITQTRTELQETMCSCFGAHCEQYKYVYLYPKSAINRKQKMHSD